MKFAIKLAVLTGAAVALTPAAASADHAWVHGRTGLPTLREAQRKIWIGRGLVHLQVVGNSLQTTQEFRLRMPGPPLEKSGATARVAFREDYYQGHHAGGTPVTLAEARGFTNWRAWVDGRRVTPIMSGWELNDKKDTATRWRSLRMHFYPGQVHNIKVVSLAPLGELDGQRTIEFVGKDIGHWRDKPDYLELRVTMPGVTEAFLTALEPKATSIGRNGIRWVYRKADPNRDVMIKLPPDWRRASLP